MVQQNVEELIESLGQHRYEENYYYKVRDADWSFEYLGWDNVERASRMIFLEQDLLQRVTPRKCERKLQCAIWALHQSNHRGRRCTEEM